MKKSIIIILAVVAILVIWAISVYNGLVTIDENVSGQWANVETQYQRRADLIPNLVNTVKGYATHEKETLEGVVAARSQATQIKVAICPPAFQNGIFELAIIGCYVDCLYECGCWFQTVCAEVGAISRMI